MPSLRSAISTLVKGAAQRRTAKNEAGLDKYQVRALASLAHAHITLAMLAATYLTATRASEIDKKAKGGPSAADHDLIRLSANEIRHLLAVLVLAPTACLTATCTGRTGADDANTRPAPAATAASARLPQ